MLVHVNPISSVSGTFTQKVLEDKLQAAPPQSFGKGKNRSPNFAYTCREISFFAEQVACFVDYDLTTLTILNSYFSSLFSSCYASC